MAPETIGERRSRLAATQAYTHQSIRPLTSLPDSRSQPRVARHTAAYIRSQGETPTSVTDLIQKLLAADGHDPQVTPTTVSTPDTTLVKRRPFATFAAYPDAPSEALALASRDEAADEIANPDVQRKPVRPHRMYPKRPVRRRIIAATAAVVTGLAALGGGLHLQKDSQTPSPTKKTSVELQAADPWQPPQQEAESFKPPPITEAGTISDQDRNGWGHSANKTQDALERNHSLTRTINIISKVGAYDSRGTSPDPDTAQSGDAMITLNEPAIELVDRLQDPLRQNASDAEVYAAQIIHRLNSLSPMETKAFIEHYGQDIESLKQNLTNILSAEQQNASTAANQHVQKEGQPLTQSTEVSAEIASKESVQTASTFTATTIFSHTIEKVKRGINKKTTGEKAIAAMAKARHLRQQQPDFV